MSPRHAFCPACGASVSPDAWFVRHNTLFCGRCGLVDHPKLLVAHILTCHLSFVSLIHVNHGVRMLTPPHEHDRGLDAWTLAKRQHPGLERWFPSPTSYHPL